jgi:hypothetical protein
MDPRISWEHTRRTGRVICQICWEDKPKTEMEPVSDKPGMVWDVCRECAGREKRQGAVY